MQEMVMIIATRRWQGWIDCVKSWNETANGSNRNFVVEGLNVLEAFQCGYVSTEEPILGYVHDDVVIREQGWDERVLKQFEDPTVGMVGFAGAPGHGTPSMYTEPFRVPNLIRIGFMSNMKSAEQHGARFAGDADVAVLDGMALFVRRSVLDKVGGWPVGKPYGFWMYSEWLCCETRRQGYRIRYLGVDIDHLGGRTSSIANVTDSFEEAHKYFWDNNRDCMPCQVTQR